jgi:hypothetical protein
MYNDTVYTIVSDKIIPAYFLDMGKFKLPEELRPERLGIEQFQRFKDHEDEYFFAIVLETANEIFLRACSYGESYNKYILFDKENHKGISPVNENGESKGIVNDWDGGIDFWPVGSTNDNQVYMSVSVMNFQKALEDNKTRKMSVKYPDKQRQLLDMVSGLDISANPILMVITLKNDK